MTPILSASLALLWLAQAPSPVQDRYEQAGLVVTTDLVPAEGDGLRAGDLVSLRFTVADSGGRMLGGTRPRIWLSARRSEMVSTETSCRDKIRGFVAGELSVRADVDLNASFFVTLNDDGTVAFINPQIAWNRTKLEAIVQLPSPGLDWALAPDGRRLYVTMPDAGGVAVIDTETRRLERVTPLPAGGRPSRIVVAAVDGSVWVGADEGAAVHALDRDGGLITSIDVGGGRHVLATDTGGRWLVVTSTTADRVTVIDVTSRTVAAALAVAGTPLRAAWSPRRNAFYVAGLNDGRLHAVEPSPWRLAAVLQLEPGIVDLGVDETGRFVLAVNQLRSRVDIVDSATGRLRARTGVVAQPDQLAFTNRFAYVRGVESESFSLIDLAGLERESDGVALLAASDIQAGLARPAANPEAIGVAPMIVPLPDGKGALIANAPERRLFYYVEGMLAPMGTFDNYRRRPRAVMVLDRSLRESSPGRFETIFTLPEPGAYDVALLLDQPQIAHCLTVHVGRGAEAAAEAATDILVAPMAPVLRAAGTHARVAFHLTDASGAAVRRRRDVRAVIFAPPGLWQATLWLVEEEPGVYAAEVELPGAGTFTAALTLGMAHSRPRGVRTLSIIAVDTASTQRR
ncbi:MAG: YncE family protein [Acidobacteriota bacterium]